MTGKNVPFGVEVTMSRTAMDRFENEGEKSKSWHYERKRVPGRLVYIEHRIHGGLSYSKYLKHLSLRWYGILNNDKFRIFRYFIVNLFNVL